MIVLLYILDSLIVMLREHLIAFSHTASLHHYSFIFALAIIAATCMRMRHVPWAHNARRTRCTLLET